jgi:hypothetical protein
LSAVFSDHQGKIIALQNVQGKPPNLRFEPTGLPAVGLRLKRRPLGSPLQIKEK